MRNRILFKLSGSFFVVIAAATGMLDISVRHAWEGSLLREIKRDLREKTLMMADHINTRGERGLQEIASKGASAAGARVTVLGPGGALLADSEADVAEDFRQRPEFVAALKGEVGEDTRRDGSRGAPLLYVAAPVEEGAVRLGFRLSDLEVAKGEARRTLLTGSAITCVVALLLSGIAAQFMARRLQRIVEFTDRIAEGDLRARIAETSGDEIGKVAAALDKTARRVEENFAALQNSQRQLETLLNSMQDAVIAVGPDARVQWANRSMDRLVPQHTRIGAPVVETVRDPDFLRVVRGAGESRSVHTARAGSIVAGRTYDVTAAPLPGGGAVAVLRDLTETERVEKTRRDFIANVSHELRTPLTSIQGYTETLLDTADSDHSRDFLEIIRKNATRMSRLTEDLLTLARVESGEQRFDVRPVAASELLNDAVESFIEVAKMQGTELQVEDASTGKVSADSEAIHQVFANLIGNALKYGASGGRIVVGARPVSKGIEFYVRDFGAGVASEHLPRLFERFYRVDKARSRESGGTGLGLAIAKHIVLAHGGNIGAESELHHGSTFLFTLPASK